MIERSRVRIPAGTAGEFSSPGSTFCADSYFGIRSTPVLPQQHVKKSRSFCQLKCRWQVPAKTRIHLTYVAFIEPCFGTGHNLSLICHLTSEDVKHQLIINNRGLSLLKYCLRRLSNNYNTCSNKYNAAGNVTDGGKGDKRTAFSH